MMLRTAMLSCLATLAWAAAASAVEVRLNTECVPEARLVTLGDVADISPLDDPQAERLAAVKLFPAPVRGKKRVVRIGELMELLTLRGFEVQEIRFTGSDVVSIESPQMVRSAPALPAQHRLSASEAARACDEVKQAVAKYLASQGGDDAPWAVELSLSPQQAEQILSGKEPLKVSSEVGPKAGRQTFLISGRGSQPAEPLSIDAEIWQTPSIVVATRDLARGERLTAADVKLQMADRRSTRTAAVGSLEQAVGKELTRGVPEGQPIPSDSVRSPRLVQRGEIVTVYAHNAGVRVRIAARAREDGGQDDLVLIESIENRKTYYGRVTGVQTVEVYAQAQRARGNDPAPPAAPAAGKSPEFSAERKQQGGARG